MSLGRGLGSPITKRAFCLGRAFVLAWDLHGRFGGTDVSLGSELEDRPDLEYGPARLIAAGLDKCYAGPLAVALECEMPFESARKNDQRLDLFIIALNSASPGPT